MKLKRVQSGSTLEGVAAASGLSADVLEAVEEGRVMRLALRDVSRLAGALRLENAEEFLYLVRLGQKGPRFQIFNTSLPKTGTTSLACIFRNYDTVYEYLMDQTWSMICSFRAGKVSAKGFRSLVVRRALVCCEMDSSSFNYHYIDILRDEFPLAKFVVLVRDCYSWLDSLLNMVLDPDREFRHPGPFMLGLPFEVAMGDCENRRRLKEDTLAYVDGILGLWASANESILTKAPVERTLVLRTTELSDSIDELARFAGVPVETLDGQRSHEFRARQRFDVLHRVDGAALEDKVERICGPLMSRLFPECSLEGFLAGQQGDEGR